MLEPRCMIHVFICTFLFLIIIILNLLIVLRFDLGASILQGKHSNTGVTLLALFALVIFEIMSHFLTGMALNHDPLDFCLSSS
jgi:hypothetical protein